jgi:hypothetical protein
MPKVTNYCIYLVSINFYVTSRLKQASYEKNFIDYIGVCVLEAIICGGIWLDIMQDKIIKNCRNGVSNLNQSSG